MFECLTSLPDACCWISAPYLVVTTRWLQPPSIHQVERQTGCMVCPHLDCPIQHTGTIESSSNYLLSRSSSCVSTSISQPRCCSTSWKSPASVGNITTVGANACLLSLFLSHHRHHPLVPHPWFSPILKKPESDPQ